MNYVDKDDCLKTREKIFTKINDMHCDMITNFSDIKSQITVMKFKHAIMWSALATIVSVVINKLI